jgi:hypothetical protein
VGTAEEDVLVTVSELVAESVVVASVVEAETAVPVADSSTLAVALWTAEEEEMGLGTFKPVQT